MGKSKRRKPEAWIKANAYPSSPYYVHTHRANKGHINSIIHVPLRQSGKLGHEQYPHI